MTRKEAANMIKNDIHLHHDYLSGEYRKALKMAISALEQPEIIRCKDCMHNGSFDTDCPIGWNGKEYCSFAERREE